MSELAVTNRSKSKEASPRLLNSPEATWAAGEAIGQGLSSGDVVALTGTLGAGKTHLCQGIVAGVGSPAAVTSPTFALVHEYPEGRLPVYHFDFYRIEVAEELWEIGWEDYLEREGVVLVEWADRFPDLLPAHAQWWRLRHEAADDEAGRGRWLERCSCEGAGASC